VEASREPERCSPLSTSKKTNANTFDLSHKFAALNTADAVAA